MSATASIIKEKVNSLTVTILIPREHATVLLTTRSSTYKLFLEFIKSCEHVPRKSNQAVKKFKRPQLYQTDDSANPTSFSLPFAEAVTF